MTKKPTRWDDDDVPAAKEHEPKEHEHHAAKEHAAKEHKGVREGEIPPETPEPLVVPQMALVTSICQVWPIPDGHQPAFGEQFEVPLSMAKALRDLGYIA